jgi:hypothetical protein
MTRILTVGLLALAAGAQAQPQGRGPANWKLVGAEAGRPGPVVKNAPFSADVTTETTVTLADGNHIRQTSSLRLYRDSEGRTRREQSLNSVGGLVNNTNLPSVVFINDPVAGVNYALIPSSRTGTRSVNGGRGFNGQAGNRAGRSTPAADVPGLGRRMRGNVAGGTASNTKTEVLGRQTVEGVAADGTRTTVTVPAGQMGNELPLQTVVETWYSPDLQTTVYSKRSDSRTGETVTRYTNINRTEPAHTLFEAPPDYKISDSPATGRGLRSGAQ